MKIFALLVSLFFLCESAYADTAIRSVDVYPSGGKIVFEVMPDKATGVFKLELPGAFDAESVRVISTGGAENLKTEELPVLDWIPDSLKPLKTNLDVKAEELKLLRAREIALIQTRNMLQAPPAKDALTAKELIYYIDEAQIMRHRIESETVSLNKSIKQAEEEYNRIKAELEAKSPEGAENVIIVSGRAPSADPVLVEAFTSSAYWQLRYTMSLDSKTGDIDVKMYASAAQQTGLNLDGNITFHTKSPTESVSPPRVNPWVVSLMEKVKADKSYDSANLRMAVPAPMAMPEQNMEMEMKAAGRSDSRPEIASTLSDITVNGSGALAGDGVPVELALGRFNLKSKPSLVLIPEQSNESWIVASLDVIETTLLPGNAELRVDGLASGKTFIPEYGLAQMKLPFGMAPRLTAKKTPLVNKSGSSFFGGSGIINSGYTIEVSCGMDTDSEISVLDRLPLPSDEKIKLENVNITPAPTERDANNRLTWKFKMKQGETLKIQVEYTLTYPSGESLTYR